MIDFGKQTEVPARDLMHEILAFIADVVPELGSREEVGYVRQILENGNGATRQLRMFQETNDLKQVVDYMIAETEHGLFEAAGDAVGGARP
jgi:carboxylate-amine ligase